MDKKPFNKGNKGNSFNKSNSSQNNGKKRPRDDESGSNTKSFTKKSSSSSSYGNTGKTTTTTTTNEKYGWTKNLSNHNSNDGNSSFPKKSKGAFDKSGGKRPGKAITKEDQEVSLLLFWKFSDVPVFRRKRILSIFAYLLFIMIIYSYVLGFPSDLLL